MIEQEYNIEQDFDDFDEPTIIEQILEKEDKEKKIKELNKTREVLDKIRAEIKSISPKTKPFLNSMDNYVKEDDVLQIIDKYRKEQE